MTTIPFGAVGMQYTRWMYANSNGYAVGTDEGLAAGEDSGAGLLTGVTQMGLALPPSRNIAIEGDNGLKGSIKLPGNTVATGQLLATLNNPTFMTGSQGLLLATVGDTEFQVNGVPCPSFKRISIVQNAPAINEDGTEGYEVMAYLNLQIQALGPAQVQSSNAHQYTHEVLGNYATRAPWGDPLTVAKFNTTKALVIGPFWSLYPMNVHTFIGNGTATTFVLDETPSGENANTVMLWENGVLASYNATPAAATDYKVVAATKTVTVGAAAQEVASGVLVTVLYKHLPTC